MVQRREFAERLHDGPADDVRVGNLALAEQRAVLIDDAAVLVHHLDRDDALRSGQRNGDAGGHVLGDGAGGAAQRLQFFAAAGSMAGVGAVVWGARETACSAVDGGGSRWLVCAIGFRRLGRSVGVEKGFHSSGRWMPVVMILFA